MKSLKPFGYNNYCVTQDGKVYSLKSNRFLKLCTNDTGYTIAYLCVNSKTKAVKVHRLVALAYLNDGYFDGAHVNHKDGDKNNNNVNNLEWVTRSQNMRHAFDTGLRPRKLTDEDVHDICRLLQDGFRNTDISQMFNVESATIASILSGKIYSHITSDYKLDHLKRSQKLSVSKVQQACELFSLGKKVREVAEEVGIGISSARNIYNRKIYNNLSNSFDW